MRRCAKIYVDGSSTCNITKHLQIECGKKRKQSITHELNKDKSKVDLTTKCWICDDTNWSSNKKELQCDKCIVWFHLSCTSIMDIKGVLMKRNASWICCKCGQSNYMYCDNMFHSFGISTYQNVFYVKLHGAVEECCKGYVKEMQIQDTRKVRVFKGTQKQEVTVHDEKLSRSKRHKIINEQSGGYCLRNKLNPRHPQRKIQIKIS